MAKAEKNPLTFTIPKKKRVVEAPTAKEVVTPAPIVECKAVIEKVAPEHPLFKNIENIVFSSLSDTTKRKYLELRNVISVKNAYLENVFADFKAKLRQTGHPETESYGFLLIGFDQEDVIHIANNGLAIETSYYGDLGSANQGVYVYKHADTVTASALYRNVPLRIMCFRTLRGRSNLVGLDSTDLDASSAHCSHMAKSRAKESQSRSKRFRNSAVFHYELDELSNPVLLPSGVLPVAVFDLSVKAPRAGHSLPSIYRLEVGSHEVYSGNFTKGFLSSHTFKLETILDHQLTVAPCDLGLGGVCMIEGLYGWDAIFQHPAFICLLSNEFVGRLCLDREVVMKEVSNDEEPDSIWFGAHFIFKSNSPEFPELPDTMRLEQKCGIGFAKESLLFFLIPSSEVTNRLGLPWLPGPHLHCIFVQLNASIFGQELATVESGNFERNEKHTFNNDPLNMITPFETYLHDKWNEAYNQTLYKEPEYLQKAEFANSRRSHPQPPPSHRQAPYQPRNEMAGGGMSSPTVGSFSPPFPPTSSDVDVMSIPLPGLSFKLKSCLRKPGTSSASRRPAPKDPRSVHYAATGVSTVSVRNNGLLKSYTQAAFSDVLQ